MRDRGVLILVMIAALSLAACGGERERLARPAPGNRPPEGFIDVPRDGTDVRPRFTIAGWVLDPEGVKDVRIYLDDELIATTTPRIERPDVARIRAHLMPGNPFPGWLVEIDAEERRGVRTIRAEAIDKAGVAWWFANAHVTIKPYGLSEK